MVQCCVVPSEEFGLTVVIVQMHFGEIIFWQLILLTEELPTCRTIVQPHLWIPAWYHDAFRNASSSIWLLSKPINDSRLKQRTSSSLHKNHSKHTCNILWTHFHSKRATKIGSITQSRPDVWNALHNKFKSVIYSFNIFWLQHLQSAVFMKHKTRLKGDENTQPWSATQIVYMAYNLTTYSMYSVRRYFSLSFNTRTNKKKFQ